MSNDRPASSSTQKPAASGLTTMRATAKGGSGFLVEVQAYGHVIQSDLPVPRGGKDAAPAPGHLMRAAVAACLAMGYKSTGAELGVSIEDVEIDLSTEHDVQAQNGLVDGPVGWQRLQWHIRLTSDADEARIIEVLDRADRLSPMLASIDASCKRTRTLEIRRRG